MNYENILLVGTSADKQKYRLSDYADSTTKSVEWVLTEDLPNQNVRLRRNVLKLAKSTLVVSFDWAEDEHAMKIIRIAREMEIQVIHHSTFKR